MNTNLTDYFPSDEYPNGITFEYPDDFVRLCHYINALRIANVYKSVETGENPEFVNITSMVAATLGISAESCYQYSTIGNWISYDRQLRDLTDDELRQHKLENQVSDSDMKEFWDEFGQSIIDAFTTNQ